MSLDAGNFTREIAVAVSSNVVEASVPLYAPWADWEPSRISHHARICCEIAREWIVATDFSSLNAGSVRSGPRWLRQRFEWGASRYPLYWCELPKKSKVDCGVLGALSYEVFTSRGVRCFPAQLVQEFTSSDTAQWRAAWTNEDAITEWLRDTLIYHEGVAIVVDGNKIKLWDSSAGWWVDPKSTSGYGSIRALRISAGRETEFTWGEHTIPAGVWTTF